MQQTNVQDTKGGNQKPLILERQTVQQTNVQDTKGAIRSINPRKTIQQTNVQDNKGAIRSRKYSKGIQYNRQMNKILKGQSKAVNHRKADNTIDKCTRY